MMFDQGGVPNHNRSALMKPKGAAARQLESTYGPLEIKVLDALWAQHRRMLRARPAASLSRRRLHHADDDPRSALSQGHTVRRKEGRAFYYTPRASQQDLVSELAGTTFESLFLGDNVPTRPILSMFVDTVSERDETLLDELEELVRARRAELNSRIK